MITNRQNNNRTHKRVHSCMNKFGLFKADIMSVYKNNLNNIRSLYEDYKSMGRDEFVKILAGADGKSFRQLERLKKEFENIMPSGVMDLDEVMQNQTLSGILDIFIEELSVTVEALLNRPRLTRNPVKNKITPEKALSMFEFVLKLHEEILRSNEYIRSRGELADIYPKSHRAAYWR